MAFMEFIFIHQMNYTGDPLKAAILRAVYLEEIDRDRGCNASSLSKSLGIPRETVRRKSRKLIERNWLVADGSIYRMNAEMIADDRFFEKIGFPGELVDDWQARARCQDLCDPLGVTDGEVVEHHAPKYAKYPCRLFFSTVLDEFQIKNIKRGKFTLLICHLGISGG